MKTFDPLEYQFQQHNRLYPTFKEWKLFIHKFNQKRSIFCLYPTFKEWKQGWKRLK